MEVHVLFADGVAPKAEQSFKIFIWIDPLLLKTRLLSHSLMFKVNFHLEHPVPGMSSPQTLDVIFREVLGCKCF